MKLIILSFAKFGCLSWIQSSCVGTHVVRNQEEIPREQGAYRDQKNNDAYEVVPRNGS